MEQDDDVFAECSTFIRQLCVHAKASNASLPDLVEIVMSPEEVQNISRRCIQPGKANNERVNIDGICVKIDGISIIPSRHEPRWAWRFKSQHVKPDPLAHARACLARIAPQLLASDAQIAAICDTLEAIIDAIEHQQRKIEAQ